MAMRRRTLLKVIVLGDSGYAFPRVFFLIPISTDSCLQSLFLWYIYVYRMYTHILLVNKGFFFVLGFNIFCFGLNVRVGKTSLMNQYPSTVQ